MGQKRQGGVGSLFIHDRKRKTICQGLENARRDTARGDELMDENPDWKMTR